MYRTRTKVDETLDVLAAHGVAGLTGMLFIGFFASSAWNGVGDGLFYGDAGQLASQALAVVAAPAYAFGATFVLLKAIALVMPLRATEREEALGMDIVSHGEEAYATGEGAILVDAPEAGAEAAPDAGARAGLSLTHSEWDTGLSMRRRPLGLRRTPSRSPGPSGASSRSRAGTGRG